MASLELRSLSKRFGPTPAADRVDLVVAEREFLALLGPSGCGKTTLLRLLAGFEVPDDGEILLAGRPVSGPGWALPPEQRELGMVFQSYALWPHMTVAGNVGFALRVRRVPTRERRRRVAEALELVGLGAHAERRPAELSGGQRQRVALARCLAMRPRLVLLDEPLANLDPHLREEMQSEFRRFHRESGASFVYVTHDQGEAMAMADRVAVMDRGRIQQIATPRQLYAEPANAMVARFVGRGMLVEADIRAGAGPALLAEAFGASFPVRGVAVAGERRTLCLRSADLRLRSEPDDLEPAGFPARVTETRFQGTYTALTVVPTCTPPAMAPALRIEHRGTAPPSGAVVQVVIGDGWIVPEPSQGSP